MVPKPPMYCGIGTKLVKSTGSRQKHALLMIINTATVVSASWISRSSFGFGIFFQSTFSLSTWLAIPSRLIEFNEFRLSDQLCVQNAHAVQRSNGVNWQMKTCGPRMLSRYSKIVCVCMNNCIFSVSSLRVWFHRNEAI